MGYISREFKDQVWNKDYGYDDFLQKLNGLPFKTSGRRIRGQTTPPSFTPSGGGTSGGGGGSPSSGY